MVSAVPVLIGAELHPAKGRTRTIDQVAVVTPVSSDPELRFVKGRLPRGGGSRGVFSPLLLLSGESFRNFLY